MKKTILLPFVLLLFLQACKKDKNTTYKVKYSVTGTNVTQFKINFANTEKLLVTPFTGTRDTTFYQSGGSTLMLDAKADSHNSLIGFISVNDIIVSTFTDTDIDGDSKTQVKIDYTISQ